MTPTIALRARIAELEAQLEAQRLALRACVGQLRDLQKSTAQLDDVIRDAEASL